MSNSKSVILHSIPLVGSFPIPPCLLPKSVPASVEGRAPHLGCSLICGIFSRKIHKIDLFKSQSCPLHSSPANTEGEMHSPTNYRDHPEFGFSTWYDITGTSDYGSGIISDYFGPEDTAFRVSV